MYDSPRDVDLSDESEAELARRAEEARRSEYTATFEEYREYREGE